MNDGAQRILIPVVIGGLLYVTGQYVASRPAREQQTVEAGREITVTGEARKSVVPDVAEITVGVQTNPLPTAQAALSELTGAFQKVVEAVKGISIPEKDIKTTNFSLSPTYDYADGRQALRGFTASEQIVVTIRDLDKVGDVIEQATKTGANQVGGVNFTVSDEVAVRSQVEEDAIKQARDKAQRLAKALGASLGDVKRYAVSGPSNGPIPFQEKALSADSAPPVLAGTNDIDVTVTVTFQLR